MKMWLAVELGPLGQRQPVVYHGRKPEPGENGKRFALGPIEVPKHLQTLTLDALAEALKPNQERQRD